jgi:hypothetical protein
VLENKTQFLCTAKRKVTINFLAIERILARILNLLEDLQLNPITIAIQSKNLSLTINKSPRTKDSLLLSLQKHKKMEY